MNDKITKKNNRCASRQHLNKNIELRYEFSITKPKSNYQVPSIDTYLPSGKNKIFHFFFVNYQNFKKSQKYCKKYLRHETKAINR